jgi:hypothetical protein
MALLAPLPGLPVLGVDFESGHQVQTDDKQVRHHDTSDDEHGQQAANARAAWLTGAGLPSRPVSGHVTEERCR